MRKLLFLATLIAIPLVFWSCGGDDGDKDEPSTSKSSLLDEESAKFVGAWDVEVGAYSHYFIFFPNGKAVRDQTNRGHWQFNKVTSVLATDIDLWQFQVTAIFEKSWTGTTINTGRGANASKRDDNIYVKELLNCISFKQTDNNDPFYLTPARDSGGTYFTTYYSAHTIQFSDITLNDDKITATARVLWDISGYNKDLRYHFYRKVTFKNPYSDKPIVVIEKMEVEEDSSSKYTITDSGELPVGEYTGKWLF